MNDLVEGCRIEGEFRIGGVDIFDKETDINVLRKNVGMVFQKPNPFPMSIYDNIAFAPRTFGITKKSELDEIVKLVGMDALSANDRLTLEVARSIREDFLQQNAFEDVDSYTPLKKQDDMMKLILYFYEKASEALTKGADIEDISSLAVREQIGRAKSVDNENYTAHFDSIRKEIDKQLEEAVTKASQI